MKKPWEGLTGVAYYRVSTTSQDCAAQRELVRRFAYEQGIDLCREYEETITGSTFDRPEFQRLLSDLRSGAVKARVLVLSDLDRLSRARPAEAHAALDELVEALGLTVIGIKDGMIIAPGETPEQELISGMRLAIAWYERRKIRQRMEAGFRRKLKRQRRGELLPGEKRIGRRGFRLTEDERTHVRMLLEAGASKAYVWRSYISKIHPNMALYTWYKVLRREGLADVQPRWEQVDREALRRPPQEVGRGE